ncbi:MAG: hypothetical protein MUF14_03465 [Hyphomonadaceae bacterium]|jgi:hypothetical protein|nr:hypothetical protein [Hyphomonadaceae bacterium]
MTLQRKITVEVPAATLESAMTLSGGGVAETVRAALADYAHRQASLKLNALRGTLKDPPDWRVLRGKDEDE